MNRELNQYINRVNRNQTLLIRKLVKVLAKSTVQVTNKYEGLTETLPDAMDYFSTMLDIYYHLNCGPHSNTNNVVTLQNLNEHFQTILGFISFEDEEYTIKLVPGHTHFPPTIISHIRIPNTFYLEDEKQLYRQ